MSAAQVEQLRERVRSDGLLARASALVAMISGGRDSTCLLDVACVLLGPARVRALHVNYGLRAEAFEDEHHCARLCERLGVELETVRAERPLVEDDEGDGGAQGNLQAWARDLRYGEAARVAQRDGALIATGHTVSDQVETIVYRFAASPGRRALLGMAPDDGRIVRPLLWATREQTAAYCCARGLAFRDDSSNDDERFARARVRHRVLPALREVHPAAEANIVRTAELLREETELLDGLVEAELAGRSSVAIERLGELPAALARMVVVSLAEKATGGYVPQAGSRVEEIIALGRRGGRAELHVGGQAGALISGGVLEMVRLPPRAQ